MRLSNQAMELMSLLHFRSQLRRQDNREAHAITAIENVLLIRTLAPLYLRTLSNRFKARAMLDILTMIPHSCSIRWQISFSVAFRCCFTKRRTSRSRSGLQRGLVLGKDLTSLKGICSTELRLRL